MSDKNGIKFAQPGSDVNTVADYDAYFYNGWPFLKIVDVGTFVGTGDRMSIPHTLKYPPFFMIFAEGSSLYVFESNVSYSDRIDVEGEPGVNYQYIIFALPLNKNFDSEVITPIGSTSKDHARQGIQMSNTTVDTGDNREFILNSDFKSPLVHKVIYAPIGLINGGDFNGLTDGVRYKFDLPYQPTIFGFYSFGNEGFMQVMITAQSPPKLFYDGVESGHVDGATIRGFSDEGDYATFVVLKDPNDIGVPIEARV
jgi:hypothetical protein